MGKLLEALPGGMNFTETAQRYTQVSAWGGDNSIRFRVSAADPVPRQPEPVSPSQERSKDLDGVPIHVLLHMKEGRLDILEIYRRKRADVVRMPPVTVPGEFSIARQI